MSGIMKASILSLLAASALAAPAPRGADKVVTETAVVTVTRASHIDYVDRWGNPVELSGPTGKAAAPVAGTHAGHRKDKSHDKSKSKAKPKKHAAPAAPAAKPKAPASKWSTGTGKFDLSSWGYGISYSPYMNNNDCKQQSDVDTDFQSLTSYGYVRIYGTDCNQAAMVLSAAQANNQLVFAGVYDITQVQSEVDLIIQAANGDWSSFAAVSVGNEGVNDGTYTVDAVVSAVGAARSQLQSAGYTGPVVTVDTFNTIIANPQLCEASDFAAANCHAFFNSDLTADQAGQWVAEQAQSVQSACGGMDTMITESGWPSNGDANGNAVPTLANQQTAISSLQSSFPDNIVLFSAFNNFWAQNNAYTFDAEWWWGINGNSTTSGPGP